MLHAFSCKISSLYDRHVISFIGLASNVLPPNEARKFRYNGKLWKVMFRRANHVKRDQLFVSIYKLLSNRIFFFILLFFFSLFFALLFFYVHKNVRNDSWNNSVKVLCYERLIWMLFCCSRVYSKLTYTFLNLYVSLSCRKFFDLWRP